MSDVDAAPMGDQNPPFISTRESNFRDFWKCVDYSTILAIQRKYSIFYILRLLDYYLDTTYEDMYGVMCYKKKIFIDIMILLFDLY